MIKLFKNLLVFTFTFFILDVSAQKNKQVVGFEGVHILIDGVQQDSVALKNLKKENIADAEVYKDADILKAFNLNRSSRGIIIVTTKANLNSTDNTTLKKKMENIFSDRIKKKMESDSIVAENLNRNKLKTQLEFISKSSAKKYKYTANGNEVAKDSLAKVGIIRIKNIDIKEAESKDLKGAIDVTLKETFNADYIYNFVDVQKQPSFAGGIEKFYEYLNVEIKYPNEDLKKGTAGKVFLSFLVEKDGSIADVKVTRSLSEGTDAEAIRVLKDSPKWKPGYLGGIPVRVKTNIVVNFSPNK